MDPLWLNTLPLCNGDAIIFEMVIFYCHNTLPAAAHWLYTRTKQPLFHHITFFKINFVTLVKNSLLTRSSNVANPHSKHV